MLNKCLEPLNVDCPDERQASRAGQLLKKGKISHLLNLSLENVFFSESPVLGVFFPGGLLYTQLLTFQRGGTACVSQTGSVSPPHRHLFFGLSLPSV